MGVSEKTENCFDPTKEVITNTHYSLGLAIIELPSGDQTSALWSLIALLAIQAIWLFYRHQSDTWQ